MITEGASHTVVLVGAAYGTAALRPRFSMTRSNMSASITPLMSWGPGDRLICCLLKKSTRVPPDAQCASS